MTLPKLKKIIYEDILPSNNKKINYTPFSVKEEKILLTAQQTGSADQMIISIKQILNNCIIDYPVEELSIFDIDYMLLKIRSKSISDTIELVIKDEEDKKEYNLLIDLNNIKVVIPEDHSDMIQINEEYTLKMKYPNIDVMRIMFDKELSEAEIFYNLLVYCLDKLYGEETVVNFDDETRDDITSFLDDLDRKTIEKIEKFFATMPKLKHEIKYTNSLGNEKTFVIEGTKTFFI